MSDIWKLSAQETASFIQKRELSAHDSVSAALARLDAVNPNLNAVVEPLAETALTTSKSAGSTASGRRIFGAAPRGAGDHKDQY